MNIYSGITYEYLKENNFSFGAELIFNRRGAFSKDEIANFAGESIGRHYVKYNFDYVSLPLKVGYKFGEKFFGNINAGLIPSYLINAKIKYPRIHFIGQEKYDITQYCSKIDFSGFAEIGGGYKFENDLSLFISFIYLHGINSYAKQISERHIGKILSIGAKYSFPKKQN